MTLPSEGCGGWGAAVALATHGWQVAQAHERESAPLDGRLERMGNRPAAGTIAAALIGGIRTLTAGRVSRRRWDRSLLGLGVGAAGGLSGCLPLTARHGRQA